MIVCIYLNDYLKYTLGVNRVKGADQGQSFPRAVRVWEWVVGYLSQQLKEDLNSTETTSI